MVTIPSKGGMKWNFGCCVIFSRSHARRASPALPKRSISRSPRSRASLPSWKRSWACSCSNAASAGSPEGREYRHGLRPRPARKTHRKRKRKGGQRRADGVHRYRYGREGQYLPVGAWLRNKPTYFRMTTQGRGKKMAARCEEGEMSPKSNVPLPKWGKNGRLLFAGCSRDRRT